MTTCRLESEKPDWKAFVLGEMPVQERRLAETHASACEACQDEWASLRVTVDAMASLREEEPPRRIAFVSDKVFEQKWWHGLLKPSFAGFALVAAAVVAHGMMTPSPVITAAPDVAAIEKRITEQVQQQMSSRMNAAVTEAVNKAVVLTREQDDRRTASLLAATERRYADTADTLNRQMTRMYAVNTGMGVR